MLAMKLRGVPEMQQIPVRELLIAHVLIVDEI